MWRRRPATILRRVLPADPPPAPADLLGLDLTLDDVLRDLDPGWQRQRWTAGRS
jgi:hypothetical protein